MFDSLIKYAFLMECWLNKSLKLKDLTDGPVLALPDQKIAYLPIPKAANSSIRTALLPYLEIELIDGVSIHEATRRLLIPSSKFFPKISDNWFVFTVVRDPTTRAQSAWRNKLIEPPNVFPPLRRMGIIQKLPFAEFLKVCDEWPTWALNDHFMPQSQLLSRALSSGAVEVFKVENLDKDWPRIQRQFADRGLPNLAGLNFMNKSVSNANGLSEKEVHLLQSLYRNDFDQFNYVTPQSGS